MSSVRLAALLFCLMPQLAFGEPTAMTVFGNKLEIYKNKEGDELLTVDGKKLVTEHYVNIAEIGTIGAAGFAIGTTSPGGNACEGSLFILSFVEKEPVRIDGPLDTCGPVTYKTEKQRIVVETPAMPGANGARWTWTVNGFGPAEALKFAASTGNGWNMLRSRSIDHPVDLLRHTEFTAQLRKLLGPAAYATLPRLLSGPGSVKYNGNVVMADACQAHSCDDTSVLIVIDIGSQKLMVALKDTDRPPIVAPWVAGWPAATVADLGSWRRRWPN
ncbi:hypothetical protein [Bradyrhizobium sp. AS23.2]|uniref:hypothetical protein n=1 Tax=Bradyrhizobium sp. AS23.2 TaxID=1680155 RepID=UPI00093B6A15|nr:hypothetical protein [Bradyrhizobium sp. AS23.2]